MIYASQNKDFELRLTINCLQDYKYELKLLTRLRDHLKETRQFTGLDL